MDLPTNKEIYAQSVDPKLQTQKQLKGIKTRDKSEAKNIGQQTQNKQCLTHKEIAQTIIILNKNVSQTPVHYTIKYLYRLLLDSGRTTIKNSTNSIQSYTQFLNIDNLSQCTKVYATKLQQQGQKKNKQIQDRLQIYQNANIKQYKKQKDMLEKQKLNQMQQLKSKLYQQNPQKNLYNQECEIKKLPEVQQNDKIFQYKISEIRQSPKICKCLTIWKNKFPLYPTDIDFTLDKWVQVYYNFSRESCIHESKALSIGVKNQVQSLLKAFYVSKFIASNPDIDLSSHESYRLFISSLVYQEQKVLSAITLPCMFRRTIYLIFRIIFRQVEKFLTQYCNKRIPDTRTTYVFTQKYFLVGLHKLQARTKSLVVKLIKTVFKVQPFPIFKKSELFDLYNYFKSQIQKENILTIAKRFEFNQFKQIKSTFQFVPYCFDGTKLSPVNYASIKDQDQFMKQENTRTIQWTQHFQIIVLKLFLKYKDFQLVRRYLKKKSPQTIIYYQQYKKHSFCRKISVVLSKLCKFVQYRLIKYMSLKQLLTKYQQSTADASIKFNVKLSYSQKSFIQPSNSELRDYIKIRSKYFINSHLMLVDFYIHNYMKQQTFHLQTMDLSKLPEYQDLIQYDLTYLNYIIESVIQGWNTFKSIYKKVNINENNAISQSLRRGQSRQYYVPQIQVRKALTQQKQITFNGRKQKSKALIVRNPRNTQLGFIVFNPFKYVKEDIQIKKQPMIQQILNQKKLQIQKFIKRQLKNKTKIIQKQDRQIKIQYQIMNKRKSPFNKLTDKQKYQRYILKKQKMRKKYHQKASKIRQQKQKFNQLLLQKKKQQQQQKLRIKNRKIEKIEKRKIQKKRKQSERQDKIRQKRRIQTEYFQIQRQNYAKQHMLFEKKKLQIQEQVKKKIQTAQILLKSLNKEKQINNDRQSLKKVSLIVKQKQLRKISKKISKKRQYKEKTTNIISIGKNVNVGEIDSNNKIKQKTKSSLKSKKPKQKKLEKHKMSEQLQRQIDIQFEQLFFHTKKLQKGNQIQQVVFLPDKKKLKLSELLNTSKQCKHDAI